MNTHIPAKTAAKVQAAIDRGFKKKAIAAMVGLSRPTFDARLKTNYWLPAEREALRRNGII